MLGSKALAAVVAFISLTTVAHGQYYYKVPPPYYPVPIIIQPEPSYPYMVEQPEYQPTYRRHRSSDISRKCALASDYIRKNNCGPQGCDVGLCIALQHGCRINSWGHVCPQGN